GSLHLFFFFFQAEDGIRDFHVTGVQTCALPILPFSALAGGWEADDPVHPADIDRMFVSLAPPGFDPGGSALLPERVNGWAEMSEIGRASCRERVWVSVVGVYVYKTVSRVESGVM